MPITLPNLDDITWEQLNQEARSLIPAHAPDWTNFNPSDPGITLLELVAHFYELLLYRTNRISDAQTMLFLRLINGPDWKPTRPLDDERRTTLLSLVAPLRAVTPADYERLALSTTDASALQTRRTHTHPVARAKCIPDRNLEHGDPLAYSAPAPGHISVVLVPPHHTALTKTVMRRVKQNLEGAKLITTRIHVVAPVFVTFGLHLTLIKQRDASADWISSAAMNRLQDWFDHLRGGPDEKGWPFGHDIYVSDLYRLLGSIPGVDYVTRSRDPRTGEEMDELSVPPAEAHRKQYNASHRLEALEIHEEELVALEFTPDDIVIQEDPRRR